MNNLESQQSQENKEKAAKVILHFFRHGEQVKDLAKTNQEYELSPAGRLQAMKKSEAVGSERNMKQTLAYGSPRRRAQQTAGFAMAGTTVDEITGEESVEELRDKIDPQVNPDLKFGSKISVDPRLDFKMDTKTPYGKELEDAYIKKEYLKYLVENGDVRAKDLNDAVNSTYSGQASGVAEIVSKYISVLGNWEKLVEGGKYQDPKLERFMGSHGGVTESFLLKVIEKMKGVEERDHLVALMPNGFDYTEGFEMSISEKGGEPIVHLTYRKLNDNGPEKNFEFDEDVPANIIEEIAVEGKSKS